MPELVPQELQSTVEEVQAETGVTGISVGLLVHGQRWFASAGVANAEIGRAPSESTLFQVGSISKTFTSAALMTLVRDGRLSLDGPAASYLPELAGDLPELCLAETTVEQLLSHTSGFDGDQLLFSRSDSLEGLRGVRRFFPPGEGWSYSNAGFSLIGAIIEELTGQPFREVVRERVLKPLGMLDAGFRSDDVVFGDVAAPHWPYDGTSYLIRGAGWQPGWELSAVDHAVGGLIASADHLLTWAQFQLDGLDTAGNELLSADELARLHTPVGNAHRGVGVGLDWFVTDVDGATVIGHGGATAGYITDLTVVPEAAVGLVVLTNATNGNSAIRPIRRWLLEHAAGLIERDRVVDSSFAPPIDQVAGRYLHAFGVLTVSAGAEPGTVTISTTQRDDVAWQPPANPDITCEFADASTIVGTSGLTRPLGTFGPVENGHASWLNWEHRLAPRID